jgi:ribosomal protein S8
MAAELHEKIGFCCYKAALQASTNIVFKKHLKRFIRVLKKRGFCGDFYCVSGDITTVGRVHDLRDNQNDWGL